MAKKKYLVTVHRESSYVLEVLAENEEEGEKRIGESSEDWVIHDEDLGEWAVVGVMQDEEEKYMKREVVTCS